MAVIGRMVAKLSADSASFKRDMGKSVTILRSSSAKMNRLLAGLDRRFNALKRGAAGFAKSMFSVKGAIAGAIGLGSAGGLILLIKRAVETADAIAKTADVIGITTDALQEYRHAAALAGIDSKTMDKAFIKFASSLGEAKNKTGVLTTFLIKFDNEFLNTLKTTTSVTKAFELYFDRIAKTADQTEKLALATAGFGGRARDMILMVKDGPEALAAVRREAHDLGIVLGEQLLRGSEAANDALERMGQIVSVNLTRLLNSLAPTIIRMGAAFAKAAPEIQAFIDRFVPLSLQSVATITGKIDTVKKELDKLTGGFGFIANAVTEQDIELGKRFLKTLPAAVQTRVAETLIELGKLKTALANARKEEGLSKRAVAGGGDTKKSPEQIKIENVTKAMQFKLAQMDRTAQGQKATLALQRAGIGVDHEAALGVVNLSLAIHQRGQSDEFAKKAAAGRLAEEKKLAALVKSLRSPQEIYNERIDELNKLYKTGLIKVNAYRRGVTAAGEGLAKIGEQSSEIDGIADNLGFTFASAFEDAIVGGKKFSDVLRGLAQDMLRLTVRKAATEPLAALASTGIKAALASFNFGGGGASAASFANIPGFKHGGAVTAGQAFKVGERGPETLVTGTGGTIIPNGGFRGGGGGGNNYFIDARGADVGAVDRLQAALLALAGPGRVEQRALAAVGRRNARNPAFLGG